MDLCAMCMDPKAGDTDVGCTLIWLTDISPDFTINMHAEQCKPVYIDRELPNPSGRSLLKDRPLILDCGVQLSSSCEGAAAVR